MNKKLIAVAVAGVLAAPVVMAENSVTIYGVADVGLEHVEAKGASDGLDKTTGKVIPGSTLNVLGKSRVTANSSYIGFKGQEELGGGLKAIWQVEQQVDIDDGGASSSAKTNGFATRDSFVGLTSTAAGTVVMGRLTTPTRAVASKLDVFPGQAGMGANSAILGQTGNATNKMGDLAFDTRKANAVAVVSPTIAGLNATVAYIADESRKASGIDPWGWGAGLNYSGGPLTVIVAYEEHRNADGLNQNKIDDTVATTTVVNGVTVAATTGNTAIQAGGSARGSQDTNARIGVGFTSGPVTVNAIYENMELRAGNATSMNNQVTDWKRDAFWIGGKVALGNNEIRLAYAQALKAKVTKNFEESTMDNSGAQQVSVGYAYNFSKRSQVYGVYSTILNKDNAAFDYGPGKSKVGPTAGADPEGYSIGIRHLF